MVCTKCGTAIKNGSKFCHKCGTKVKIIPEEAQSSIVFPSSDIENPSILHQPRQKKMIKSNKALISILCVLVVLIVTASIIAIVCFTGREQKIVHALEAEDYNYALEVYNENFSEGEASERLVHSLKNRLEQVKNDFIEETIEYSVANIEISTIEKMQISAISDKVQTIKADITALNTSRTAFNTAETLFDNGDYPGALENYRKVIEVDKNYEIAKEKVTAAVQKYRTAELANAAAFVDSGAYSKAIAELENALKIIPDDIAITEKLSVYKSEYATKQRTDSIQAAAVCAEKGDFVGAMKTMEALRKEYKDDAELEALYEEYKEFYVSSIVTKVNELTGKKQYSEAKTVLDSALKLLPQDATLAAKLDEVQEKQPVLLSAMTPVNGGWEWNEGDPTDPFGTTYSSAENFGIITGNALSLSEQYSEYRIYGRYKYLTGDLISHKDCGENAYAQVKIYADDVLVYTSPKIVRKSDLTSLNIDINGVDYVKIVVSVSGAYIGADKRSSLLIMNMKFLTE